MKTLGLIKDKKSKKVFLLPQEIQNLKKEGIKVTIPANYGLDLEITDSAYIVAGADVVSNNNEVIKVSDIICKVNAFDKAEIKEIGNKIAVSTASYINNVDMIYHMMEAKTTGLAWNYLYNQKGFIIFPKLEELKGKLAMKIITDGMAKGLCKEKEKVTYPKPANLLIINATFAAVTAAKWALANGFNVTIADMDKRYLNELSNDAEIKEITAKNKTKFDTCSAEFDKLTKVCKDYNALIATAVDPMGRTKKKVSDEMAKSMPKGSILVDASCEYGDSFIFAKKQPSANIVYERQKDYFAVTVADLTELAFKEASKIISTNSYKNLVELAKDGVKAPTIKNLVICQDGNVQDKNIISQLRLY